MQDMAANTQSDAIAVVGLSMRVAGANDVRAFWNNVLRGVESISRFSDEELLAAGVPPEVIRQPNYVNARGVLEQAEFFDAQFFGYSVDEASVLDPQQRVLLECAWHALEHAGYDPEAYDGRIGLYAGASVSTYWLHHAFGDRLADSLRWYQVRVGNDKDFLATRVSYKLNLVGPSMTVQTACSTSLAAVATACQSLLDYQSDIALAGGVSIAFPQKSGYLFHDGGIASPDGHCRAFAAQARGCVNGEGVGLVVLKRLGEALASGATIHGVIRGWAINNDGSAKVGFTAPSVAGQTSVIQEALAIADVDPATVGYVEGHGTGTPIGDPIEVSALTQAFRTTTDKTQFCGLGSVKTNIGHLDAAAGVVGLIKALLAVKHGVIPPSLHFDVPNPKLDLGNSPFYVPVAATAWPAELHPRRAGVSSFGIGGTNVHVILEQPPPQQESGPSRPFQLLTISARTPSALDTVGRQLAEHLRNDIAVSFADVAYTLQVGRRPLPYRRAVTCRDAEAAISILTQEPPRLSHGQPVNLPLPVFFMFPGQGAQVPRMGSELYKTEPAYRRYVDICADVLASAFDFDVLALLHGTGESAEATGLMQTEYTQPALFTVEYALARMWMDWGIKPAGMIGHSIGEYVAACLAGVFELEDAFRLVMKRGALMQQTETGAMLAAEISEEEARELVSDDLWLASVNAPTSCTLSGSVESIASTAHLLGSKGIRCVPLHTSRAFHSGMMQRIVLPFTRALEETRLNRPSVRYISNVTGTWITDQEATSPQYWGRHLRETVRFADGVSDLLKVPAAVYLEVGPGSTLASLVRRHSDVTDRHLTLCSLPGRDNRRDEHRMVLETLGSCWVEGVSIDWPGFHVNERRNRLALPCYPFERRPFLLDRSPVESIAANAPVVEPERDSSPSNWFYAPMWRQTAHAAAIPDEPSTSRRWLILADDCGIAQQMTARLRARGERVLILERGALFAKLDDERYAVDFKDETSFGDLVAALSGEHGAPDCVVHLWSLDNSARKLGADVLKEAHERGIGSLLFLIKAMIRAGWQHPMRIGVVTNEMQAVLGLAQHPEQAPLLGLCRVVPREYPHINCQAVDISLDESISETVSLLLDDLSASESDACIAYRGGRRWTLGYQPVAAPEPSDPPPLRRGGTYLITGGLGGIGLALAEYLYRTADANLVLVTRSGSLEGADSNGSANVEPRADSTRKREMLSRLESGRGQVLMLRADITDPDQLVNAIARAEVQFGAINGVIHAAGLPGGGLIRTKTFDEITRVFAPKIEGTVRLVQCLGGKALDFLVLCSSLSSIMGELGQADYCAANAFLDAFAQSSAVPPGVMTIALNWDRWIETGMAVNAAAASLAPLPPTVDERPQHPLLDVHQRNGEEEVYTTYFSPQRHWVLEQHRVGDCAILPGTAYIELAAAAFGGGRAPDGPIEFRDVYFLRPLQISDDETIEVRTMLRRTARASTFRIVSIKAGGGTMEHAGGTISGGRRREPWSEKPTIYEASGQYRELSVSQLLPVKDGWIVRGPKRFGPRWNVVRRITATETGSDVCAILEASPAMQGETGEYYADPALLDVAISYPLLTMIDADDDSYLVLGYKRLVLDGPLPARISSRARWPADRRDAETLHWDVAITDEHGAEVGRVERLTVRRARAVGAEAHRPSDAQQREDARLAIGDIGSEKSNEPKAPLVGLTTEQGVDVFRRALCGGLPQTIVSIQDLTMRLQDVALGRADARPGIANTLLGASEKVAQSSIGDGGAERSEIVAAVFAVWREVLGAPVEGPNDDFFRLGGDSLLAVRLTIRLREQLGVSLSVDAIFDRPTVGELCDLVSEIFEAARPGQTGQAAGSS
jgi:acyl transferase domain-containing protein/acyl carrier protein